MKILNATRYVTPLREGGSMPAIVEADDLGLYVLKFRGAGQGIKVLIAELIGAALARRLELNVPEVALVKVPAELGRNEPDTEIRELLKRSVGLNLALDYLPRSITFDPIVGPPPPASEASRIVWLDAFITNVDRTPRNPNLLCWHKALYLIDHGASLYFRHADADPEAAAVSPFSHVRNHVLLPFAGELRAEHERCLKALSPAIFSEVLAEIPDEWLGPDPAESRATRETYRLFLERRLESASIFVEEAVLARAQLV